MSLSSGSPAPTILVRDVGYLGGHRLHLSFSDGRAGVHDFASVTARTGSMIAPLADPVFFARAFVEDGVLTWPNGYDWDPESLHAAMLTAGEWQAALATE